MGLLKRLNGNKYSVLEVNFLSARRTGHVKAQLPLDPDDFDGDNKAENGMLLKYNTVTGYVEKPDNQNTMVMLHFSVEKEYDNIRPGLNTFALEPGEFYPRLYGLSLGDTWTTDAVELDSDDTDEGVLTAYEGVSKGDTFAVNSDGFLDQSNTAGEAVICVVVDNEATLPNGGKALKFEVLQVGPKVE